MSILMIIIDIISLSILKMTNQVQVMLTSITLIDIISLSIPGTTN
jgi:hypothetical protein